MEGESVEETVCHKWEKWEVCLRPDSYSTFSCPLGPCFIGVRAGSSGAGWGGRGLSPESPQARPQAQRPGEQAAMEKESQVCSGETNAFLGSQGARPGGPQGKRDCVRNNSVELALQEAGADQPDGSNLGSRANSHPVYLLQPFS